MSWVTKLAECRYSGDNIPFARDRRAHQYVRIDPDTSITGGKAFRMDDTAAETLDELERIGDELAVTHNVALEQFVQLLMPGE